MQTILIFLIGFYFTGICNCSSRIKCVYGRENEGSRIIGGTEVKPNRFPFMASVTTRLGSHFCGGSLINDRYVLTAAHCVFSEALGVTKVHKIRVALGLHDVSDIPDNMLRSVSKIIVHKDYNNKKTHTSDIALIRLADKVKYEKNISPICLTTSANDIKSVKMFFAIGWGDTVSGTNTGSNVLMHVPLAPYEFQRCNNEFKRKLIEQTQFCAGTEGKDTCQGDSGGPLMFRRAGRVFQAGITSFGGNECGAKERGVYTKVGAFIDWIDENTKDASFD